MVGCRFDVIDEVRSADAALSAVGDGQPDSVVLDIEVAGTRGLGIVSEIRARAPGCDVIVLSLFDGLRMAALAAGASAFTGKLDLRELRSHLESFTVSGSGSSPCR